MKTAILGLVAALTAGALVSRAEADPTLSAAAAARALSLETGQLRLQAGLSFPALWKASTPRLRQAAAVLAPRTPAEASLLTDFFAHAVEVRSIQGDRAVTGWRDPVTDVWMLGDWSRQGDGWRLDRLTLALTQALAPAAQPAAPLEPAYSGAQEGLARAIAAREAVAVAAFRRAAETHDGIDWNAAAPSAVRARNVALLRLQAARDSLAAMSGVVPKADRLVRIALVEETPATAGVSPSVADKLHGRSVETRLSLQPIQYLPGRGEALAVVQSAFEPEWLFVVHLAPTGEPGAARVSNVEAVDLTKAAP